MKNLLCVLTVAIASLLTSCSSNSNFASGTIDMGVVVSDSQKSLAFYKSLGFVESPSFEVPKEITGDAGLLDYKKATIHVLSLNGAPTDTKLKLMQLPGDHKKQDQTFIDSTYGASYITIFVKDMNKVVEKVKMNKIKILAKGPVDLTPVGFAPNFLLCIKDPDGNYIEFVGPMAK